MKLPDGWTNVTVARDGEAIPAVKAEEYNPNMAVEMACTIKDVVLYFDAGVVIITKIN